MIIRLIVRRFRSDVTHPFRVRVSDGQGTVATYPWLHAVGPGDPQWLHAATLFLTEQRGRTDLTPIVTRRTSDGAIVEA